MFEKVLRQVAGRFISACSLLGIALKQKRPNHIVIRATSYSWLPSVVSSRHIYIKGPLSAAFLPVPNHTAGGILTTAVSTISMTAKYGLDAMLAG